MNEKQNTLERKLLAKPLFEGIITFCLMSIEQHPHQFQYENKLTKNIEKNNDITCDCVSSWGIILKVMQNGTI